MRKKRSTGRTIAFNDNQPCLLLLSQRPYGILRILDDQSTFPQATDQTFLQKCHYHHVSNPLYCKPKMPLPEFSIKHYAGKVTYQIVADEFREHTKEVQRTSLGKLQGPGRRYQPPTVAAKFSHSLFELMEKMAKCNSFFVRCLKPNRTKEPNLFELEMMSSQLRYSGIFETIRIRKDGYPIRLFFSTFLSRYKLLTGIQNLKQTDHNNCIVILRALCEHSPGELYQIGITRVFLKERLYLVLERRRERLITQAATTLQKHIRAYQTQRRYADLRKKVILLQAQVRGFQCRRRYQCLRRGLIRFRATVLMYLNRKKYLKVNATFHVNLFLQGTTFDQIS
uniref:Myosin motor domain-containing protein n=1 Tax=Eptatretus burgeri TaxID=7764 RepID=A0A8C4R1X2_EPTBU